MQSTESTLSVVAEDRTDSQPDVRRIAFWGCDPQTARDLLSLYPRAQVLHMPTGPWHSGLSEQLASFDPDLAICDAKSLLNLARCVSPGNRQFVAGAKLPLTARQRLILSLLRKGFTNVELAGMVGASPRAIKHELQTLFCKLHVSNRTELVASVDDLSLELCNESHGVPQCSV
jgi:DNA-binding CsgD family transcriptional regulator